MSSTKTEIYNLAFSALLLKKVVVNTETDTTLEVKQLNKFYQFALNASIQDLGLDSMMTTKTLELMLTDPNPLWKYQYKYPNECIEFRRIQTAYLKDNRNTRINFVIRRVGTTRVIFTNEEQAVGEYLSNDITESVLSVNASMAVAYKLAYMASSLQVGKNSLNIKQEIEKQYAISIFKAQELDKNENFTYDSDEDQSEWVDTRINGVR